jgi:hypothetical protein
MLRLLVLGSTLLAAQSSVTIVPVDAFGEAITGCRIIEFLEASLDTTKPIENPRDFSNKFVGLRGTGIEGGIFDLTVRCDKGYRGHQSLWLMRSESFIVVQVTNRVGDDHFGGKPRLAINVRPSVEGAWIRAINPYEGMTETALVDPKTGTASLYNVSPGKYEIFLLKPGQILCAVEYDHKQQGDQITLSQCAIKQQF